MFEREIVGNQEADGHREGASTSSSQGRDLHSRFEPGRQGPVDGSVKER